MTLTNNRPVVLVTGSAGLIGSRVSGALSGRYQVVGLDRVRPEEGDEDALWIECDLTDTASVQLALQKVARRVGTRIASVIHLAAHYDFSGEPSPLYDELTVEGTRRLLQGLRGFDVEQFVFSSSLLVMQPSESGRALDENSPVQAEWEYPRSKLDAESVMREEHGSIPAVVLRIAGVYDEQCHSIPIAQQMRRIYERQLVSYFFPGDPEHGQSFVHLDDLVRCLQLVIDERDQLGEFETFLVGEEDVVSYAEMQDILGSVMHDRHWPTIRIPAPLAKAGAWIRERTPGAQNFIKPWMIDQADAHYPVSIRHAREVLGWEPRKTLRETLPDMARRFVADPVRWYRENGIDAPAGLERRGKERREVARQHGVSRR